MHIIFKNQAMGIDEKYTVLDLDTFSLPDGSHHTACCVVESIPIMELSQADSNRNLHANLIKNYGQRNWSFCEQAIEHLTGKWGGELDSFYEDMKKRIDVLKTQDLTETWSPVIPKH